MEEKEVTRAEMCELTCMVMVYDDDGNVLVQDKKGKNWSGINFPGENYLLSLWSRELQCYLLCCAARLPCRQVYE